MAVLQGSAGWGAVGGDASERYASVAAAVAASRVSAPVTTVTDAVCAGPTPRPTAPSCSSGTPSELRGPTLRQRGLDGENVSRPRERQYPVLSPRAKKS